MLISTAVSTSVLTSRYVLDGAECVKVQNVWRPDSRLQLEAQLRNT